MDRIEQVHVIRFIETSALVVATPCSGRQRSLPWLNNTPSQPGSAASRYMRKEEPPLIRRALRKGGRLAYFVTRALRWSVCDEAPIGDNARA